MDAEGLVHHGVEFLFEGKRVPVPLTELTAGKSVMVYGQTEVTRDLMAAREACGAATIYGVSDVTIKEAKSDRPSVSFTAMAKTAALSATLSPAATAFTGCPARASRQGC